MSGQPWASVDGETLLVDDNGVSLYVDATAQWVDIGVASLDDIDIHFNGDVYEVISPDGLTVYTSHELVYNRTVTTTTTSGGTNVTEASPHELDEGGGFGLFFEIETYHKRTDQLRGVDSYLLLGQTDSVDTIQLFSRARKSRDNRTRWVKRAGLKTPTETNADVQQLIARTFELAALNHEHHPEFDPDRPGWKMRVVNQIVFEVSDAEAQETFVTDKTPYYALDRVKRGLKTRGVAI